MQKPNELIEILSKNTIRNEGKWKHKGLYRQLYNIDLFAQAYQNIYQNTGNLTKGTDGKTIDNMSLERFNEIIEKLKNESYKPVPVKRVYIPKKNGKQRPLGIPSFDDKLVQECIRIILESIYEPIFSKNSHGFRPNKSCHTAMQDIKKNSNGMIWWIEGDIKGFFDNIDHNILIEILEKKIDDERFLRLIRKFLKNGYLEDWKYNKTISGTPQGGIISPILANIYLNEFDKWVEDLIKEFNQGISKKPNPEYKKFNTIRGNTIAKINRRKLWLEDENISEQQKDIYRKDIEKMKIEISVQNKILRTLNLETRDPMDKNFKRMTYTRYADDWVIGIIGNKEDAKKIKENAKIYLKEKLKLELSEDKTLITNGKDGFQFLGFYIRKNKHDFYKKNNIGVKQRIMHNKYQILMPYRKEYEFIIENGFAVYRNGNLLPQGIKKLFTCDDLEIMEWYNSKFRGIYNYYRIADNVCKLQQARYFWKMSWGKTMGNKYRTTKSKMLNKYRIKNRIGIKYQTSKGENICYLFDEPLKKQKIPLTYNIDDKENWKYAKTFTSTSLMDRLKANKCEMCGKENVPLQMHHVKKVKDLKNKKHLSDAEKLMIKRNRKTIALCEDCHSKCHLDDNNNSSKLIKAKR